ncbi:glycosyltransferase family 39 protein [Candidatus Woesearchaeota archaeon]|nr:glycosyltransferase family 39 protein [Candidatus Woesearchaeota archaeon]
MKKIWGLLICVVACLLILNFLCPALQWDENAYLGNARGHFSKANYTEDFRFPLLEHIIASVWIISGESIFIARLVTIFFTLGSIYLFYLISLSYFKRPLLPTIFFSFCSLLLEFGFRVYTDVPCMFFILAAFYCICKKKYFLSGLMSSLAFLMRFPSALFSVSTLTYIIFKNKKNKKGIKRITFFALGSIIPILPWVAYNFIRYNNPLWDFLVTLEIINEYSCAQPILLQMKNLLFILNVLFPFFVLGLAFLMKEIKKKEHFLIAVYLGIFFIYYLFFVNMKLSRYYIMAAPFLYLVSFIGIAKLRKKKFFALLVITIFIIYLSVSVGHLIGICKQGACEKNSALSQSIDYLKERAEDKFVISNMWPWYGYIDNAKVSSLWIEDIDLLIEIHNPKYFAMLEGADLPFNQSSFEKSTGIVLEKIFFGKCGDKVYLYSIKPEFRFKEVLINSGVNISTYSKELVEQLYNNISDFAKGDILLILGRLTGNYSMICSAEEYYEKALTLNPEEQALIYESIASLICDINDTYYLLQASKIWKELGNRFRAELIYKMTMEKKIEFLYDIKDAEAESYKEKTMEENKGQYKEVLIGNTTIVIDKDEVIVAQAERVSRDWLSSQIFDPYNENILTVFSEKYFYNETELLAEVGWHEGARIKEIEESGVGHIIAAGTLAKRDEQTGRWYAPNEDGIFMFEVPEDKIYYPTTRFLRDDLVMIIDTHGINMLVEQAVRYNASIVIGCCDHPGKIKAVEYLSEKGIKSICFTDRFLPELIGKNVTAIGSPPMERVEDKIILGLRPISIKEGEKIVVMNSTTDTYGLQYYDTPTRYFRKIANYLFLDLHFVTINNFNQMDKIIQKAEQANASIIAIRVFNSEDYTCVKKWLMDDSSHKAILFHSASYPYGDKLLTEFPSQTSFGDINPIFR